MMVEKLIWKKNLYSNKGFADNYTDVSFLEELKKNLNFRRVKLLEAIEGAALLTQEINAICTFIIIFVYLYNEWLEPTILFIYSSLATFIGLLVYQRINNIDFKQQIQDEGFTVLIFLLFGYIASPILHTLTDTISTDTIFSQTLFMLVIHLLFFDYGLQTALVSRSISLNSAIFSSICLASRLSSPFHAFVFMTVAFQCFALFPKFRMGIIKIETEKEDNENKEKKKLERAKNIINSPLSLLVIMLIINIYLLYRLSFTMVILFALFIIFINIVCPILFVRWLKYKENIYGPWDEAIIKDINNLIIDQ